MKYLRKRIKVLSLIASSSLFLFLATFIPAFAETADNIILLGSNKTAPSDFASIACIIVKIALDFIPFLVIIAVGDFLIGLIKYVSHGDNEEKRTEGTKMMVYGILGFFIMVSVWGILDLFTNGFGLGNAIIPQFKASQSFKSVCN
jgi:hypothetical protein